MFPYIAGVYVDYLPGKLGEDVWVSSDVPPDRPARLVTVDTAPAGATDKPDHLAWRRLVFRCWATGDDGLPDEYAAGTLAEQVRAVVVASRRDGIGVRRVRVIGEPARLTDPEDGTKFFQVTTDVLVRASR